MQNTLVWEIKRKLTKLNWPFIRGSLLLSLGMAFARILGFAFSLLLAREFTPEDYGVIQYAITLAMVISIGTQPFGQHVLAWFVSKYNNNKDQLSTIFTNASFVLALITGLTLLLATPVLLIISDYNIGIFIIFIGLTVFYAYWGFSRGLMATAKLVTAFIGSNIVQLITVLLVIYVFKVHSPLFILFIYGLSYFLPLILLQTFWPHPGKFSISLLQKGVIKDLLKFSLPILVSFASYTLYNSLDILFLKSYSGYTAVGVYKLGKTLAIIFLFVPAGISTLLMPQAVTLPRRTHINLLKRALVLSISINILILIIYLYLIEWFVINFFGSEYLLTIYTYTILALAAIALGIHGIITAILVGRGNAGYETISRVVALFFTIVSCWLLIPLYGLAGTATSILIGALFALITYGGIVLIKKPKWLNSKI